MCCFIQQSSNQIDTEVLEGTGCQVNTIRPETKKKKRMQTPIMNKGPAEWINQSNGESLLMCMKRNRHLVKPSISPVSLSECM